MYCAICNIQLSNNYSYNRHITTTKHYHNLKNPYHKLNEIFPKDISDLIWKFTYPTSNSIFDQLEHGNMWKVKDLIWNKKIGNIEYHFFKESNKIRELRVNYRNKDYKEIIIKAGDYHLHLGCPDSEYVWKKISHLKDKSFKTYHFGDERVQSGYNILI